MTRTVKLLPSLAEVDAAAWDGLHDGGNPFVTHAFLHGLETTGCLRADWGWSPLHLTLWDGDALIGAMPGYAKHNSHGEFVFDHAWAHAWAQHGLDYYPKWLCAVPYSPVTGPRLLARDAGTRTALVQAAAEVLAALGWSSAHVNFHPADEDALFDATWLARHDIQYHWHNGAGWATFDDFLAAMDSKHRKAIRAERRKVREARVTFRIVDGTTASDADLRAMHDFYLRTFADYGNSPALTLAFLQHLAQTMPRALVIVLAEQAGEPIAGALCLRGRDTLYGRYWGASLPLPGLHFETCYYQGIDYCLSEGLTRFEPGAQGRHKIDRGFLPVQVRSRHRIADPRFARALAQWCAQERAEVARRQSDLMTGSPFKRDREHA